MSANQKITLAEARKQGKLDQFVQEREAEQGDADALEKGISSMAGKSKEAPRSSSPPARDD